MKNEKLGLLTIVIAACCVPARAHPASGIVVDSQGQVFFAETGDPDTGFPGYIWKIDAHGKLVRFYTTGAHWLAIDSDESFAGAKLDDWFRQRRTPNFERVTPPKSNIGLLGTDGMPFVILKGGIYYGNTDITRLSTDGTNSLLSSRLKDTVAKLDGIKGLAVGPDGSIYIAAPSAVLKAQLDGTFTTVVHPIVLTEGDSSLPPGMPAPGLRGLTVDESGNVYAAASGCRCVVRITPDGQVQPVLKSEAPWSPTGVAYHGGDIYVLEYSNANSSNRADWLPRVRKLGRDGKIHVLAVVSRGTGVGQDK